MDFQTKVFLVHMSKAPMSKLLINVKRLGMMSEGYASFVTASTMNLLSSIDSYVIGSMQGLVGSKSNIPATKDLQNLALRLRRKFSIELSVYGIWAYDSIWALAEAVERARDYNKLVSSIKNGSLLVEEILRSRFFGLSGSLTSLRGRSMISTSKMKLRIGVPGHNKFKGFVDLIKDPQTNLTVFSGFCIEAFMLAIRKLPYPVEVEFIPNGGTYNDLVYQLYSNLKFNDDRFKLYSSPEEYAEALSKGSKHGGVSAIVDEAPYIKRFVAKYPSDYTLKTMPMSNISGFGYKGSTLVQDISKELSKLKEAGELVVLEKKWTCSRAYSKEALLIPSDDTANDPNVLSLDCFRAYGTLAGSEKVPF
ncbi:hypothetical protein FEM48_Zijuj07G0059100 [Ziziphus jujuba var. spinosa]|uniref:Ionotropic glutamate receptor C-terminal domain-containing protein n=1 Tax=Ziziphus jujuba var. spinosa TaxID=714518 RepID=A0A978V2V2_ZIZJJ|nr:hypothetical protein FEM48_Zijuj07G0059100 [Ziziphus jujuba var. spinosa]